MKNRIILIFAAVLVMASGCKEKKAEQKFQALPFPDVQIPSMISDEHELLSYLSENYWNNLTDPSRRYPSDSLLVSGVKKEIIEQKFADWMYVLDAAGMDVWNNAISRMYDRALKCEKEYPASNVFETIVDLSQKYMYAANSPLRNEEMYLHFVNRYSKYEGLSEVEKGKYSRQAKLCALNRLGTKATDFRFADKRGKIRNLYDIDAELTLLFFSNPGCNACMDIINVLNGDPQISGLVAEGKLAVLNIYIDEDLEAWKSYMPVYPESWYNGFDPDFVLKNSDMYNIRAIPSLYLLDAEKRVILKDAPENVIFSKLAAL